jgi:hypothetical protein
MLILALVALSALPPNPAYAQGRPSRRAPSALPPSGIALGDFEYFDYHVTDPPPNFSAIGTFIGQLGHTPAFMHGYYSWKNPDGTYRVFPKDFADYVVLTQHSTPFITWEPGQCTANNQTEIASTGPEPDFSLGAILSGMHDAYIETWADAAKAYPHIIYVRLMHEMEGPWYLWGYGANGNTDPKQYIAAFQHIVGIFHQKSVTNVQFVWCPGSSASTPSIDAFFPGDDYADWVGMDGYNKMTNGKWQTASDVFSASYAIETKISSRPLLIAEIGSVENPNDATAKPNWITDTFLNVFPNQMPRIKAVLYFNNAGHGYTFPLNSSPASWAAYLTVVNNPLYQALPASHPFLF